LYALNDIKVGSALISNIFGTRNNADHTRKRTFLAPFYKMSNLLQYEPLVDEAINSFFVKLDDKFITGESTTCKIDEWILFFAWDVVGQLTFGRPMGFMDEGKDHHGGLLSIAEKALDYFAVIGQMPQLDQWLAKNPVRRIPLCQILLPSIFREIYPLAVQLPLMEAYSRTIQFYSTLLTWKT
jgi:hypothetical protein